MKKLFLFAATLLVVATPVLAYDQAELVRCALETGPKVTQLKSGLKKAKADTKNALSQVLPKVNATLSGSYIGNPIGPIDASTDSVFSQAQLPAAVNVNPYIRLWDGMEKTYYSASLDIQQPLFTWGKLADQISIYRKLEGVESNKVSFEKDKIRAEVVSRSFAVVRLGEIISILEGAYEKATEMESLAKDSFAAGMITKSDSLEATSAKARVYSALETAKGELLKQVEELKLLTGIADLSADVITVPAFDRVEAERYATGDLLGYVSASTNPNQEPIKMAREGKEIRSLALRIAKKHQMGVPDLGLDVRLGYSGPRFMPVEQGWYTSDDWQALFTVALKTAVFDLSRVSDVEKAAAESDGAEAQLKEATLTLAKETVSAWTGLKTSLANLDSYLAQIDHAESKVAVTINKMELGSASRLDVLKDEVELDALRAKRVEEEVTLVSTVETLKVLVE